MRRWMPFRLMYCLHRRGPAELTSGLSPYVKKPKRLSCCVEWVLQGVGSKNQVTQRSCRTQVVAAPGILPRHMQRKWVPQARKLRSCSCTRSFSRCIALCLDRKMSCLQVWSKAGHGDLGMEIPLLFNVICLPLSATLKIYSLVIKIDEVV